MVLGSLRIEVEQKNIKNIHLSVHPPQGKVRIAAPLHLSKETIRLYAISKLKWIKTQQKKIRAQERESQREFVNKETHYYLGRKYLLRVIPTDATQTVVLNKKYIDLYVHPRAGRKQRQAIFDKWYRKQLKEIVPDLIQHWETTMRVQVSEFGVRRMKTRWGSCNLERKKILLNLELVKKPIKCIEYIIVHEMVHLLERNHNERFVSYMNKNLPGWRRVKEELNEFPLSV